MDKLIITIETTNDAFSDMEAEVSRILKGLAASIYAGNYPETLRDLNGNTVGTVEVVEPEPSRKCTECAKPMSEGYCIDGGREYYCADGCLHKHYTEDEWQAMYADGESDSYWTTWED